MPISAMSPDTNLTLLVSVGVRHKVAACPHSRRLVPPHLTPSSSPYTFILTLHIHPHLTPSSSPYTFILTLHLHPHLTPSSSPYTFILTLHLHPHLTPSSSPFTFINVKGDGLSLFIFSVTVLACPHLIILYRIVVCPHIKIVMVGPHLIFLCAPPQISNVNQYY